jgi:hypothetical protein
MRLIKTTISTAFLLLLPVHAPGMPPQDPAPQNRTAEGTAGKTGQKPAEKAEQPQKSKKQKAKTPSWPKLKFSKKSTAKDKINLLLSKKPKVQQKARDKILSYGPGVVPILLAAYHDRQKQPLLDQLRPLLDELVSKEYGPVLAVSTKSKNETLTRFTLRKLDSLEDPQYRSWFLRMTEHKNKEISDRAWYALAHIGDIDSLDFLIGKARKEWNKEKDKILPALVGLKGDEASKQLLELLEKGRLADKLAALRLLHGIGTKSSARKVATYLNSKDHALQVAAVNALLGIVDGKKPHHHLSVFDSIDIVKKWKRRMGV